MVVALLELSKTSKDSITTSSTFSSFKNNYLLVYSLMMGSFFLNLHLFHKSFDPFRFCFLFPFYAFFSQFLSADFMIFIVCFL